ncbi:MAG: PEP-CTERM sorting domain-containing protein [Planctomycetaceae bacterium]|nr:PEP-CTERM sorting domain-containing protein [Planctomycetaceae bacterium]
MRKTSLLFTLMAACAFFVQGTCFADMNAAGIVTQFNALNGGKGIQFSITGNYGYEKGLNITAGTTAPNLNAFVSGNTSGTNFFDSFCVETSQALSSATSYGVLNYANNKTTNSTGTALNLGVAKLYKEFATGTLANYAYGSSASRSTSASDLQTAIWALLGMTTANWTTNTFLSGLLAINSDQNYWKQTYDPNQFYNEIGNYSIFVIQITTTAGAAVQDFLYITQANNSSVPEPATLALWVLGSAGALGIGARRKFPAAKRVFQLFA